MDSSEYPRRRSARNFLEKSLDTRDVLREEYPVEFDGISYTRKRKEYPVHNHKEMIAFRCWMMIWDQSVVGGNDERITGHSNLSSSYTGKRDGNSLRIRHSAGTDSRIFSRRHNRVTAEKDWRLSQSFLCLSDRVTAL